MRKALTLIMSLVLVAGVFRLATMDPVAPLMSMDGFRSEMPDCPMGFLCPAQFESAQLFGAIQTPASLGLLLAFIAAFTVALASVSRRPHASPLRVFTDSGPPALRSIFKKE